MKTKVVFFGTGNLSLESLKTIENDYEIVGVVTKADSLSPSGQKQVPPVKKYALSKGYRVFQPEKLVEINNDLIKLNAEVGVLVAYGKIIPQSTIDIFPKGIVNVHGSILPKYRGASPIETAILNGEKETGVSLMLLTAGMDEGPVIATEKVEIGPLITRSQLYKEMIVLAQRILKEKLPLYLNGSLAPTPQDDSQATYTKLIKKEDGKLDFSKSAAELERQIRAYEDWPGSFFEYRGKNIEIIEAKINETKHTPGELFRLDKNLAIGVKDKSLAIKKLKPEGKKIMTGVDFLNGHQEIK
ncbi:MAG: methionyl-tRNA formyltransferase [bacterium]|nr:methionyl-tRNA formyltransferase [bacterium]